MEHIQQNLSKGQHTEWAMGNTSVIVQMSPVAGNILLINMPGEMRIHADDFEIALAKFQYLVNFKH